MAAKPDKTPPKAANGKPAPKAAGKSTGARATTAKAAPKTPRAPRRKPAPVTSEMIAERAYYIAESGSGTSDLENWLRAEAELLSGT